MTRDDRITPRRLAALVGYAIAITCVLQVVCYGIWHPDTVLLVLWLSLPVTAAAVCVEQLRPDRVKGQFVHVGMWTSVIAVYALTLTAFVPVTCLRGSGVFGWGWLSRSEEAAAFRWATMCCGGATAFGLICLFFPIQDRWLNEVADKSNTRTGEGVGNTETRGNGLSNLPRLG